MMLKRITLIVLLSVAFFACEDNNAPETLEGAGVLTENPTDFQECGWLIDINGVFHKPTYLPPQYEIEGLDVRIIYVVEGQDAGCQDNAEAIPLIRLIQVRSN